MVIWAQWLYTSVSINLVVIRRARLVLGWVTVYEQLYHTHVTIYPGRHNLETSEN